MTRSRLIIAAAAVTLAVIVGGFVAYDQVLRGDSAAALSLPTASASASPAAPASSPAASCFCRPCLESGDHERRR